MVSVPRPNVATLAPRQIQIAAGDGYPLGATVFEPPRPRGTVVIHGATAVPQRYYAAFADWLRARRLRVITYDYRGIGASRPASLRGFAATMTEWGQLDARAVHAWARDHGDDVVIVGHSFGGQLLGLVDELREAKGALLVAAQLGGYRDWPRAARPKLALTWYALVPAFVAAFGYLPAGAALGVDLPGGVALEWARWCRHRDYLVGYHPDAAARFARWDRPTRLISFADDDFAPPGAIEALASRLGGAPLERDAWTPGDDGVASIGHFGFFRPSAAALWPRATAFLEDALAGEVAPGRWVSEEEIREELEYGR